MKIIAGVTPGWELYTLFDVRLCAKRYNVHAVDDELHQYIECDYTETGEYCRIVQAKQLVIIKPEQRLILINAVRDDAIDNVSRRELSDPEKVALAQKLFGLNWSWLYDGGCGG